MTLDDLILSIRNIVPQIPAAIVMLLIGIVFVRIVSWITQAALRLVRMPKGLHGIVVSLVDALLWVFLVIILLHSLRLDNLALIFSGGIAALGLALGAGGATLASDILAGVFLAQDKDYNIGDLIKAGDAPTEGVLESMDMRRSRVRDKDGKLHVIPNSVIERKEWVVITRKRDM